MKYNIDNINNQLSQWRKIRNINKEKQQKGFLANILEELTEFERGILANDIHEIIDSCCDIITFSINANIASYDNKLPKIDFNDGMQFIQIILKNINNKNNIIELCFDYLYYIGYDPFECMLEVCKELHSRSGHYDESIGKFVKDTGFYTLEDAQLTYSNYVVTEENNRFKIDMGDEVQYRPKWYKADYSKCKLKGKE